MRYLGLFWACMDASRSKCKLTSGFIIFFMFLRFFTAILIHL
jgi:hypothetical protein